MRFKVLSVLLAVVLGSAFPVTAETEKLISHKEAKSNALAPLYLEKRYIGVLKNGRQSCPEAAGWRAEKLLDEAFRPVSRRIPEEDPRGSHGPAPTVAAGRLRDTAARQAADPQLLHELGLDKLCVYTALSPAAAFAKPPGLTKAARDRMGLSATGPHVPSLGNVGDQIWPTLANEYVRQLGEVQFSQDAQPAVRLVFIDTQQTGEGLPAKPSASWHGYSMVYLAHRLLCGDPATAKACPVQLATRLALHYDYYNKDMMFSPQDPGSDQGGSLGRISDLAKAIIAEVDYWQRYESGKKLILNLSVGWDGELHEIGKKADLDARSASDLDPASLAVYKALGYARRRGALVIAAAGNRRGGPEESTLPLLPPPGSCAGPRGSPSASVPSGSMRWAESSGRVCPSPSPASAASRGAWPMAITRWPGSPTTNRPRSTPEPRSPPPSSPPSPPLSGRCGRISGLAQ